MRRSERVKQPMIRYTPSASYAFWDDPCAFTDEYDPFGYAFAVGPIVRPIKEPASYKMAMKLPDKHEWTVACQK